MGEKSSKLTHQETFGTRKKINEKEIMYHGIEAGTPPPSPSRFDRFGKKLENR